MIKFRSMVFSLNSLFMGRGPHETINEGLVQPTKGYIRVAKEPLSFRKLETNGLIPAAFNSPAVAISSIDAVSVGLLAVFSALLRAVLTFIFLGRWRSAIL